MAWMNSISTQVYFAFGLGNLFRVIAALVIYWYAVRTATTICCRWVVDPLGIVGRLQSYWGLLVRGKYCLTLVQSSSWYCNYPTTYPSTKLPLYPKIQGYTMKTGLSPLGWRWADIRLWWEITKVWNTTWDIVGCILRQTWTSIFECNIMVWVHPGDRPTTIKVSGGDLVTI